MGEVSETLVTFLYGKTVAWNYPAEFSGLFGGFMSRFQGRGSPEITLRVDLRRQEEPFEIEGNACFFRELPPEIDFIHVLSYWTRGLLAPRMTDALVFHASGITSPSGPVLMMGPRGSGKSTLVRALCEEGHGFLGEDSAPVGLEDQVVFPTMPMSFLPKTVAGPARLSKIISLCYAPGSRTTAEEVRGSAAAIVMLRENFNLRATGTRGLTLIAALSERGIFCLTYPEKDEGLAIIREVARLETGS